MDVKVRCSTSLGFVLQTLWPEVRGCDIYLGEIEDMSYTFMEVAESIFITPPPLQRKKMDGLKIVRLVQYIQWDTHSHLLFFFFNTNQGDCDRQHLTV